MNSEVTAQTEHRLSINLSLDPGGVVASELLLSGSRDQDVAVSFQNVPVVGFGSGETHNGAMVLQSAHIYTHVRNKTCHMSP